jgi:hypothetical protein
MLLFQGHGMKKKSGNMSDSILFIFIHQWLYSPLLGPGLFFSFVIFFTQMVGLLGRVMSPSQGRYLHTEETHTQTSMPLSGIRSHDPSVRASEDSSCLRPRGHRHRRAILCINLFGCCCHLEHKTFVKRFVSLQFLNLRQSVGLLGRRISSLQVRYLHTDTE